jgi:cytochrome c553
MRWFARGRPPVLRLAALLLGCAGIGTGQLLAQQPSLGERLLLCGTCHGVDGNSTREKIPSLAGQPEFFILNQLFLMREGVRRVEQMEGMTSGLKDQEIQAIATHFTRLTPKASPEKVEPELVERGRQLAERMRCGSCHLPTLAGQDQMPRLARQRIDYMLHAMQQFRDNRRSGADTAMTAAIVGVPDADLAALAHYAAQR